MGEKKQDLTSSNDSEAGSHSLSKPPEPHLLDPASLAEGARWLTEFIALAAAGGVILIQNPVAAKKTDVFPWFKIDQAHQIIG